MSDIEMNDEQNNPKTAFIAPLGNKEKDPEAGHKRRSLLSRALSAAPGILVGAGVMYGVKTAALATAAAFSAPAALALAGAAATVGLAAGGISYYKEKKSSKLINSKEPHFWTSHRLKTMCFHSAMTVLGGLLFTAIDGMLFEPDTPAEPSLDDNNISVIEPGSGEEIVENTEENIDKSEIDDSQVTDIESNEEELSNTDDIGNNKPDISSVDQNIDNQEAIPLVSAFEKAQSTLLDNECITDRVKEAMVRAENGSAQGIKDIAYFMFNGFDCVTQNQEMAVDLFKQAADMGNVQAQVDLAYIQYHGLAGVESNTSEALDKMIELANHDNRAQNFVTHWTR